MKALSKLKAEEGIWMVDAPEPEVGHNDLLIKFARRRSVVPMSIFITGMNGHKRLSRYR